MPLGIAAATLLSAGIGGITSMINRHSQKKTQEETWKREDTAVQRRSQDLIAAGINPVFAAGSAASSSPTQAPELSGQGTTNALAMSQIYSNKATTRKTNEEAKYVELQQDQQRLANMYAKETLEDRVQLKQLERGFQQATQEWRIDNVLQDLRSARANAAKAEIDRELARTNADSAMIDLVQKRLAVSLGKEYGVQPGELEYLAKYVTYKINQYNRNWYEERSLPTNAGLDTWLRWDSYTRGAMEDALGGVENSHWFNWLFNRDYRENARKNKETGGHGASREY